MNLIVYQCIFRYLLLYLDKIVIVYVVLFFAWLSVGCCGETAVARVGNIFILGKKSLNCRVLESTYVDHLAIIFMSSFIRASKFIQLLPIFLILHT